MRRQNVTGRRVAYLRNQRKWTQQVLAAKLQCEGVDISRLSVARMEYGILKISDSVLAGLQRVFRVPIIQFFPPETQEVDAKLARRIAEQPADSVSPKKLRQWPELTKRRKRG